MASQDVFEACYRGRQNAVHHMSYLRMCKVLMALSVQEEAGIDLEGKSLFDYGFGAGTWFRYCPRSARLQGVEMDAQTVAEVSRMLAELGYAQVRLETIEIARWQQHPLLAERYGVILFGMTATGKSTPTHEFAGRSFFLTATLNIRQSLAAPQKNAHAAPEYGEIKSERAAAQEPASQEKGGPRRCT